jgi:hypothetical protein
MEAEHMAHLGYCETRWLSCAILLHRVLKLMKVIAIFVSEVNKDDENLFTTKICSETLVFGIYF